MHTPPCSCAACLPLHLILIWSQYLTSPKHAATQLLLPIGNTPIVWLKIIIFGTFWREIFFVITIKYMMMKSLRYDHVCCHGWRWDKSECHFDQIKKQRDCMGLAWKQLILFLTFSNFKFGSQDLLLNISVQVFYFRQKKWEVEIVIFNSIQKRCPTVCPSLLDTAPQKSQINLFFNVCNDKWEINTEGLCDISES